MSAPSRAQRDGATSSARGRGAMVTTSRGRASSRGSLNGSTRGRGRGRGRGAPSTNGAAEGLLQGLRTGTLNKRGTQGGQSQTFRGRGNITQGRPVSQGHASLFPTITSSPSRASSPVPSSHKDFMNEMTAKFQVLKQRREAERAKAIRDGFLADPDKKTSLDKAITPVGTCTDMCPEFERIERIVQNMVDKSEKVSNQDTGRDIPSEARMIKRFRRSAAGYDEQLPSDIRTPSTLKATLDYLLDKVVGREERLASVHKFVWDRTRGIRNDFSIQQVSREEDVKIAVDCFERIARFHILSLHQLSNPDNLQEGENFDAHQDREQLNNTLLSLIYYYDDYRGKIPLPNEAEFRAYCIVFELQSQHPDLEDRMQSWPKTLLDDGRVKTAFKLFSAAGNTIFDQGPLRPLAPFAIAQGNSGSFWTILQSRAVSYLMACVGEIYFSQVRFAALSGLWKSAKSSPAGGRAKIQDWTLPVLSHLLAFDDDEQTLEFCQAFGLTFKENEKGAQFLDLTTALSCLDQSTIPKQQIFSSIVEQKRFRRTLVAVINGVSVPRAIRQGLVEEAIELEGEPAQSNLDNDTSTLFIPETTITQASVEASKPSQPFGFNPQAPAFSSPFGNPTSGASASPLTGSRPGGFGAPSTVSNAAFEFSSAPSITTLNKTTSTPFPGSISGSFGSDPPFSFKSSPPASTAATSTYSAPFTSFTPAPTSTSTASPIFPTSQPTPSMFQFPTPSPAPSFTTTFDRQNPKPNTLFSPAQAATRSAPTSFPAASTTNFPGQGTQAPIFSFQPLAAAPPSVQTPQAATPAQLPTSPSPASSQLNAGISQLPPSPRPGLLQLDRGLSQSPSLFPGSSSTNAQAGPSSVPSSQPAAAPLFTSPFLQSSETLSKLASGPFPSFTPQTSAAGSETPPFDFFANSQGALPPQPTARSASLDQNLGPGTSPRSKPAEIPSSSTTGASTAFFQPRPLSALVETEPPQPRVITEAERETAIDVATQLALLQERGLLTEFIEHIVEKMLPPVVTSWEKQRVDDFVKSARTTILARKYGNRWRKLTWHNILQRKAKIRRKAYEDFYKQEEENRLREQKQSKELTEILQAQAESRIMQEQIRKNQLREEKEREERREEKARVSREMLYGTSEMSRKRKSMGDEPAHDASQSQTPRKLMRTHRRSRTVGGAEDEHLKGANPRKSLQPGRRISLFSGKESQFGQFVPDPPSYKKSKTRTDYFRLKALGIDPEAPIVPHTASSLAKKQKRDAEEDEEWLASVYSRSRMKRPSPSPQVESKNPESAPVSAKVAPVLPQLDSTESLQAIAEIKAMLEEGTQWYKEHSAILKEECEQQEEMMRRSASSYESIYSPKLDADGLATAPTGYKYRPDNTPPGQPLSRTEMRIRMTGAGGFATAPIGGTPGYKPRPNPRLDYLWDSLREEEAEEKKHLETNGVANKENEGGRVEKSLQSPELAGEQPASNLAQSQVAQGSPTHRNGRLAQHNHHSNGTTLQEEVTATPRHYKSPQKPAPFKSINSYAPSPFAALGNADEEDELLVEDGDADSDEQDEAEEIDELLEEEEEEYEDQPSKSHRHLAADDRFDDGDDEDVSDEDDYDEDEEDGEDNGEESDEGVDMDEIAHHAYLKLPGDQRDLRGGSQMSRATSGTGASVEDALVLDSD